MGDCLADSVTRSVAGLPVLVANGASGQLQLVPVLVEDVAGSVASNGKARGYRHAPSGAGRVCGAAVAAAGGDVAWLVRLDADVVDVGIVADELAYRLLRLVAA